MATRAEQWAEVVGFKQHKTTDPKCFSGSVHSSSLESIHNSLTGMGFILEVDRKVIRVYWNDETEEAILVRF